MATSTIGLPDGRTTTIDHPDDATQEQILKFVKKQYEAGAFDDITAEEETSAPVVAPLPTEIDSDSSSDPLNFLVPENGGPRNEVTDSPQRTPDVPQDDMPLSSAAQASVFEKYAPDVQDNTAPLGGDDYAEKRENPDLDPNFLSFADQEVIEMTQQRTDDELVNSLPTDDAVTTDQAQVVDTLNVDTSAEQPIPVDTDTAEEPETIIDLPDPDWGMYQVADDLGQNARERLEIAYEIYEQYENHPDTERNAVGELIYNGIRVPRPISGMFGGVGVPMSQKITDGVRDGARNFAITAALVGDLAVAEWNDEEIDPNESWAVWLDQNLSKANAGDKWYDGLLKGVAELGGGFGVGKLAEKGVRKAVGATAAGRVLSGAANSVATNLSKLSPTTARGLSSLSRFARAETYMAAGLDADSGTMLIGDDRAFDWLQGFETVASLNTDPNADDFEELYDKKRNILMEAIAIAAPATAVVEGAAWTARTAYSFGPAAWIGGFQQSTKERFVVEQVLNKLAGGADNPEALKREIVDIIKANQDVFIQMDGELIDNIEFKTTAMDALRRGIEDGADDATIRTLLQRAAGIDKAAITKGGTEIADTLGTVSREVDAGLGNAVNTLGGEEAADASLRAMQAEDMATLKQSESDVAVNQANIRAQEEIIQQAMVSDPLFADALQSLANRTGIDPEVVARGRVDDIIDAIDEGLDELTSQRDELYSAVTGNGGKLDPDVLEEGLSGMSLSELEASIDVLPNGGFKTLLQSVQIPEGGNVDDAFQNMVVMLNDAGITDYGKFFATVRRDAAVAKDALFKAANAGNTKARGAALRLDEFVKFIDGPLLDAAGTGINGAALRESVEIAKQFDANIYFDTVGDGVIGRIYDLKRVEGPVDFRDQARMQVRQGLSNDYAASADQLMQFLDSDYVTNMNSMNAVNYVMAKVLEPIANRFDVAGEISEDVLIQAITDLQTFGAALDNVPEAAERIAQIRDGLRSAAKPREVLEQALKESQATLAQAKADIFEGQFKLFWQKEGVPWQRGFKVFEGAFDDVAKGKNSGVFSNLNERILTSGDPLLIEGYQAAMAQKLRKEFFGNSRNISGDRAVSAAKVTAEEVDITQLLKAGQEVFGETHPGFMVGLERALMQAGDETRLKLAKPVLGESATAVNREAAQSFDRMVTFYFGVLSRIGAVVRSGGQAITRKLTFNEDAANQLAIEMLNDPDYFVRVADQMFGEADRMQTPEMIAEGARLFLYRSGMLRGEDAAPDDDFDAVEAAAQLEAIIADEWKKVQEAREMAANEIGGTVNPFLRMFGFE